VSLTCDRTAAALDALRCDELPDSPSLVVRDVLVDHAILGCSAAGGGR
jgi:hypothetical protein